MGRADGVPLRSHDELMPARSELISPETLVVDVILGEPLGARGADPRECRRNLDDLAAVIGRTHLELLTRHGLLGIEKAILRIEIAVTVASISPRIASSSCGMPSLSLIYVLGIAVRKHHLVAFQSLKKLLVGNTPPIYVDRLEVGICR